MLRVHGERRGCELRGAPEHAYAGSKQRLLVQENQQRLYLEKKLLSFLGTYRFVPRAAVSSDLLLLLYIKPRCI